MKPQSAAITIALIAIFSMCNAPARSEVVDGFSGKWKAANHATIFEVFPDGSYKSTINGVVVETGKINASNGIWIIRADSSRVDKGSYTLNGGVLQLKGESVTTVWHRISAPTLSSASAAPKVVTGSFASPASATPTVVPGTGTTTTTMGSATPAAATTASTPSERTAQRLSDKERAIQRFKEKYAERSGGFVRRVPGGVMNDRQARKFWRGY